MRRRRQSILGHEETRYTFSLILTAGGALFFHNSIITESNHCRTE
jgi:hypothetical protein